MTPKKDHDPVPPPMTHTRTHTNKSMSMSRPRPMSMLLIAAVLSLDGCLGFSLVVPRQQTQTQLLRSTNFVHGPHLNLNRKRRTAETSRRAVGLCAAGTTTTTTTTDYCSGLEEQSSSSTAPEATKRGQQQQQLQKRQQSPRDSNCNPLLQGRRRRQQHQHQCQRRRFVSGIASSTVGFLLASESVSAEDEDEKKATTASASTSTLPPPVPSRRIVRLSSGLQFSDARVGSGSLVKIVKPSPSSSSTSDDNDSNSNDDDDTPHTVADVLYELLSTKDGTLRHLYEHLVTTKGEFYELAAVVTNPGSKRQQVHPDLPYQTKAAPLYVVFLALQDVTVDMGPTTFLLKTHNNRDVQTKSFMGSASTIESKNKVLQTADCRQSTLAKGDAVVFDARVLHCGNANNESTRVLFNFSFRNPEITGNLGYPGSIRPGYSQAMTLEDVTARVDAYGSSKHGSDSTSSGNDGTTATIRNVKEPFGEYGDGLLRY
mmetsp:Transcript_24955/g.51705  ORF Transcript_24955/g.51705 Transcript_24955/m.51705 type:complete len:486 (+) Transcript_24955:151-1608(+)